MRYEYVSLSLTDTSQKISDFTGYEIGQEHLKNIISNSSYGNFISILPISVGKWRKEMTEKELLLSHNMMGYLLKYFCYEVLDIPYKKLYSFLKLKLRPKTTIKNYYTKMSLSFGKNKI